MKRGALPTARRLARLQSDQAGDAVRQVRAFHDDTQRNLQQLEAYRDRLSASSQTGQLSDGQMLRSRAAFTQVADSAVSSARESCVGAERQLKETLQRWHQAREKERILGERVKANDREEKRERERREEASQQPAPGSEPQF